MQGVFQGCPIPNRNVTMMYHISLDVMLIMSISLTDVYTWMCACVCVCARMFNLGMTSCVIVASDMEGIKHMCRHLYDDYYVFFAFIC